MIGNEEKTEMRLKETNEHGIILMSIKNLFEKIGVKNDQNGYDVSLVQHKNLNAALGEAGRDGNQARTQKYDENECLKQLEVVKAYIQGFDLFLKELSQPIENTVDSKGKPSKLTYFEQMAKVLQDNPQTNDEIDDFLQFDPTGSFNR